MNWLKGIEKYYSTKFSESLKCVPMSPSRGGWGRKKENKRSDKSIFAIFKGPGHSLQFLMKEKDLYHPLIPRQRGTLMNLIRFVIDKTKMVNPIKKFSSEQLNFIFG